jgi:hypothetical protein
MPGSARRWPLESRTPVAGRNSSRRVRETYRSNLERRRTSWSSAALPSDTSSSPHSNTSLTTRQGVDPRRRKKLTSTFVSMTTRDSPVIEQPAQPAASQPPVPGFPAGLLAELKQPAYVAASAGVHGDANHDIRLDIELRRPWLRQLRCLHLSADHLRHGAIGRSFASCQQRDRPPGREPLPPLDVPVYIAPNWETAQR